MNDPRPPAPPEYKVYRSRRNPLAGLRPSGDLDSLRKRLGRNRNRGPREPHGDGIAPGRIIKWIVLAVVGWLLLSLAIFMISAQLEEGVSAKAKDSLSAKGSLFSGSTILVLGTDQRTGDSIDKTQQGPPRADTIMLVHAAFGSVRKLSIPRDVRVEVPGHGTNKINAAYALGGPALTVETVESFLGNGLEINHLMEVDFEDFPALIDSLGGVTVDSPTKVCSPPFDNFWKGLKFKKGENELDGAKALGYARIRKNDCAPNEDDRARARRQQEVLAAMRSQAISPTTFLRLPWVSWRAPKTLKTDMRGPALMGLFADLASGGSGDPEVLETSCCMNGTDLFTSEGAKADAVRKLVGD